MPKNVILLLLVFLYLGFSTELLAEGQGGDLGAIKKSGVLRHLGIPYANFVTGAGDGLDVELIKRFARYLGIEYGFVESSWSNVIGDLMGKEVVPKGDQVEFLSPTEIKGDVIATGFTVLPWRKKVVQYSDPIFPSQVWVISRSDSLISPIEPSGDLDKDTLHTKEKVKGFTIMGVEGTCLDPNLYNINTYARKVILFSGNVNDIVPAIINKEADTAILDAPVAMVNLQKWPGQIKIIGPVSEQQTMAYAFRPDSQELLKTFNNFLKGLKERGEYLALLKKYYPSILQFFPECLGTMGMK